MKACSKCDLQEPHVSFNKNQNYCKSCQSFYRKAYWQNNRKAESATNAVYYAINRADRKKAFAKWAQENRTTLVISRKNRYQKNKDRLADGNRARVKAWGRKNPHKKVAAGARHKASKLRATPRWAKHHLIEIFYAEARKLTLQTGSPWHVDHIVPLQGKTVCGLHWEGNLQVIVGKENSSKGNRYWPDMAEAA